MTINEAAATRKEICRTQQYYVKVAINPSVLVLMGKVSIQCAVLPQQILLGKMFSSSLNPLSTVSVCIKLPPCATGVYILVRNKTSIIGFL